MTSEDSNTTNANDQSSGSGRLDRYRPKTIEQIRTLWGKTIRDASVMETGDPTLTYKRDASLEPDISDSPLDPVSYLSLDISAGLDVNSRTMKIDSPSRLQSSDPSAHQTNNEPTVFDPKANTASPSGSGRKPLNAEAGDTPGFQLIKKIGEGGMGIVYQAKQLSLMRDVAVKKVKDAGRSENLLVSEAYITGFLDHPNIVPVHTLGRDVDGRIFLAMKLIGGQAWFDLLHPGDANTKQLSLEENLRIMLSVCNAVAFAHSKNVMHRDLKPENIMVGDFGEVLLMDWGLALDMSDPPTKPLRFNHILSVNAPAGTPAYMAPEMANAEAHLFGPWTDVYLLGAILHELLTGNAPHNERSLIETVFAAARNDPKTYDKRTPALLAGICLKAMATDIFDRYSSVSEFKSAIESFLSGEARRTEADQIVEKATKSFSSLTTHTSLVFEQEYEALSAIQSDLQRALTLWPDNAAAADEWARVATWHADRAIVHGDLLLAKSQLATLRQLGEDVETFERRIAVEQRIRETRQRNLRLAVVTVFFLLFAIVIVGAISLTIIDNQRQEAVILRDKTEEALNRMIDEQGKRERAQRALETEQARAERPLIVAYETSFDDVSINDWRIINGSLSVSAGQMFVGPGGETYATLDRSISGDIRVTATIEITTGSEATVWFLGSDEKTELEGYSIGVSNRGAKLQRFGKTVATAQDSIVPVRKPFTVIVERVGYQFRGFLDNQEKPFIEWTETAPLKGSNHNRLGVYVSVEQIAVQYFRVERYGYAPRSDPLHFVDRLIQTGEYAIADRELEELAFSHPEADVRARATYQRIAVNEAMNKMEFARSIEDRFINGVAPLNDSARVDYSSNQSLVRDIKFGRMLRMIRTNDPELNDTFSILINDYPDAPNWTKAFSEFFTKEKDAEILSQTISSAFEIIESSAAPASEEIKNAFSVSVMDIYFRLPPDRVELTLSMVLKYQPDSSIALVEYGRYRTNAGDYDAAIESFNRALSIDPTNTRAILNRGIARFMLDDWANAEADYNYSIDHHSDKYIAYRCRGDLRTKTRDIAGAIDDYSRALEIKPDDIQVLANRGTARYELGDITGAVADLNESIKYDPLNRIAWSNRAAMKALLSDFQGAISDYNESIKIDPNNPNSYHDRGITKYCSGGYISAISDFDVAIAFNPDSLPWYYQRGLARLFLGQYSIALTDLSIPGDTSDEWYGAVRFIRCVCFIALDDLDSATKEYAAGLEAADRSSDNDAYWRYRAIASYSMEKTEDYNESLERFKNISKEKNLFRDEIKRFADHWDTITKDKSTAN